MTNGTFIEKQLVSLVKKKAISEIRLRQSMCYLGVSVCVSERESSCLRWVKSKPLFVPPIQPMLRLGFNLKNDDDDDELEAHPVSAKSTSIKFKIILIWPSQKQKMNFIKKRKVLLFYYGRKTFSKEEACRVLLFFLLNSI